MFRFKLEANELGQRLVVRSLACGDSLSFALSYGEDSNMPALKIRRTNSTTSTVSSSTSIKSIKCRSPSVIPTHLSLCMRQLQCRGVSDPSLALSLLRIRNDPICHHDTISCWHSSLGIQELYCVWFIVVIIHVCNNCVSDSWQVTNSRASYRSGRVSVFLKVLSFPGLMNYIFKHTPDMLWVLNIHGFHSDQGRLCFGLMSSDEPTSEFTIPLVVNSLEVSHCASFAEHLSCIERVSQCVLHLGDFTTMYACVQQYNFRFLYIRLHDFEATDYHVSWVAGYLLRHRVVLK